MLPKLIGFFFQLTYNIYYKGYFLDVKNILESNSGNYEQQQFT